MAGVRQGIAAYDFVVQKFKIVLKGKRFDDIETFQSNASLSSLQNKIRKQVEYFSYTPRVYPTTTIFYIQLAY